MRIFIDLDILRLRASSTEKTLVSGITAKRGDAMNLEIVFLRDGIAEALPENSTITFAAKEDGKYDAQPAILAQSFAASGTGSDTIYTGTVSLSTEALDALLLVDGDSTNDVAFVDLMAEVTWTSGDSEPTTTRTFGLRVNNDVYRGDESTPSALPDHYDVWLSNEPQTWTTEQKAQARANIDAVATDDSRLSDSRTPTAHQHVLADISDAGTAAAADVGDFAAASHTHVSADISDASTGGNGSADAGKLAKYDADGSLTADHLVAKHVYATETDDSDQNRAALFPGNGTSRFARLRLMHNGIVTDLFSNPYITEQADIYLPSTGGTLALTDDIPTSPDGIYAADYGIVMDNSADAVAEANATALATAIAASATLKTPLYLPPGNIYVKGAVTLTGTNPVVFAYGCTLIQKDTAHHGMVISEVSPVFGLEIYGLTIEGQGASTHNAAAFYGRRASLTYLTSDITLWEVNLTQFRTGLSLAQCANLATHRLDITYVRTGIDFDGMQSAVLYGTRIVQGDGNAASAAIKSRGSNFAVQFIGGEYGGAGFARFGEIADGASLNLEGGNLEAFTSAQMINITNGGTVRLRNARIACTHAATGAVISANASALSYLPIVELTNCTYNSSGRLVEIYGTATRGPTIIGQPVKVSYAATQGGTVTHSAVCQPNIVDAFDYNWPTSGTIGAGALFLSRASTVSKTANAFMEQIVMRSYNRRTAAFEVGALNNNVLLRPLAYANEVSSTTSETDLLNYTAGIAQLYTNGETIYLRAHGTTAANANNKQIKFYLGGALMLDFGSIAANDTPWNLEIRVQRGFSGTGNLKVVGVLTGMSSSPIVKINQSAAFDSATSVYRLTATTPTANADLVMNAAKLVWERDTTPVITT